MIMAFTLLLGVGIVFIVLPALILVLWFTKHRDPQDFDACPECLLCDQYGQWRESILSDIAWMRQQDHREVSIRSSDGISLKAEWYPRGDRLMILSHGYCATPMNNFSGISRAFLEAEWSLLTIYQRGHGKSEGRTTLGLAEADDLVRWASWANEQANVRSIVIYGMSMGGAAINLCAPHTWPSRVKALIVDCAYSSVERQMLDLHQMGTVIKHVLTPFMRLFMRLLIHVDTRRDGLALLRDACVPMFFIGGITDDSVSVDEVQRAYNACGADRAICIVPNAPHTLAWRVGGEELQSSVFAFIEKSIAIGGYK